MTRICLLACFLMSLSSNVWGQKIRYTDTSNEWVFTYGDLFTNARVHPPSRNYYDGTTTINGKLYNILREEIYNKVQKTVFVREDTNAKVVYYGRYHHQTNVFFEFVYIDYNLQVGDTIKPYEHYYVTAVDSVLINNSWHKLIELYCPRGPLPGTSKTMKLLEGVGYISNPTYPEYSWTMRITLNCFFNNNTRPNIPILPLGNQGGCSEKELGIDDHAKVEKMVHIYPQPAYEKVTIELPSAISHGEMTIMNSIGQIIYKKSIDNQNHVIVNNNFPQGLYYYRITNNATSNIYSGRLIFAD